MAFSTSTVWWSCHLGLVPKHFHHCQRRLQSLSSHFSFLSPSPWQSLICFLSIWIFCINGFMYYVTFYVWLLLLNMLSRFLHIDGHVVCFYFHLWLLWIVLLRTLGTKSCLNTCFQCFSVYTQEFNFLRNRCHWFEGGREGEKGGERERHQFVVPLIYAFTGCFLHVPWPRIEPSPWRIGTML